GRAREVRLMRHRERLFLIPTIALLAGAAPGLGGEGEKPPGVVRSEVIYEKAPFPQCHASTIAETKAGLGAAWVRGTREKHPDVGIWVSRHVGGKWTAPVEVADGKQADRRLPCWNPVLFQPKAGPLLLFYRVGPSPSRWWTLLMKSQDHGKTWS